MGIPFSKQCLLARATDGRDAPFSYSPRSATRCRPCIADLLRNAPALPFFQRTREVEGIPLCPNLIKFCGCRRSRNAPASAAQRPIARCMTVNFRVRLKSANIAADNTRLPSITGLQIQWPTPRTILYWGDLPALLLEPEPLGAPPPLLPLVTRNIRPTPP